MKSQMRLCCNTFVIDKLFVVILCCTVAVFRCKIFLFVAKKKRNEEVYKCWKVFTSDWRGPKL